MADKNGLFRKKMFGGFNKKDVFKFYDDLKKEHNDGVGVLKNDVEALEAENALLKEKIASYEADIASVKEKEEKIAELNAKLESKNEMLDTAAASLEQMKAVCDDNEQLKLQCSQLENEVATMQRKLRNTVQLASVKSELEKQKAQNTALKDKIAALPDVDSSASPAQMLGDAARLIEAVEALKSGIGVLPTQSATTDSTDEKDSFDFEF